MFRIVCDPSSGSKELYLTEIRCGSLMFVVCLIGVWQRIYAAKHRLSISEPLRISVKYSFILPDDGSHTI